ncbi:Avr9/Cf-9 rapidly elicited protein [Parasponia andersonii]|uniref:Avr9/Cf-9 rapidly elicited protein n=1 Tax=Parasponia andersonii TaxID=3476 RepID=A0A2P5B8P0_PARAD|nr:Avr9/Cf-9 rapidly elicited protein [Parasponia andersonii]
MDQIEASTSVVAKKLWNIVRVVFIMMRKGLSKSKIMVEFHMLMKRGKLAGKAMAHNFILNHSTASAAFSCRSNDAVSFVSPREYEFSCSNSPAAAAFNNYLYRPFGHFNKRNKHSHYFPKSSAYDHDDVSSTVSAVQKVLLEMYNLNNNYNHQNMGVEASPLVTLPGFGKSPLGMRQLRITDSPFPLNNEGGDTQVDSKAEDFINKFYKNLKLQRLDSPARKVLG